MTVVWEVLKMSVSGSAGAGKYSSTAVGPVNVFLGVPRLANYPAVQLGPPGMFSRELAHSRPAALISAVPSQGSQSPSSNFSPA